MPTPAVHRKPWEERSTIAALVLAVLVPGLGHLYQGRILKGLIYFFGIVGLFVWGIKLGEGVIVYNLPTQGGSARRITLHYAAQFGVGLISYPALLQQKRAAQESNHAVRQLDQPLTAQFSGRLTSVENDAPAGKLEGTVSFRPEPTEYGTETKGTFVGTLDGKPIELPLVGNFLLDRPISAGFHRGLRCGVAAAKNAPPGSDQMIVGWIPRSIMDGYGVPPDMDQLQEVTGRLGKQHELGLVFTWIAGLLNILAIWDCVQGPAYGFGDESWNNPAPEDKPDPKPANAPPMNKAANPA